MIKGLFTQLFKKRLLISKFKTIIINPPSLLENKQIRYCLPNTDQEIGYIEYNVNSGKICLFFMTDSKHRNRGLGSQILNNVLDEMKEHGTKRAWLVTNKYPHPFWEKHGFTYLHPPHHSVTYHGYIRAL